MEGCSRLFRPSFLPDRACLDRSGGERLTGAVQIEFVTRFWFEFSSGRNLGPWKENESDRMCLWSLGQVIADVIAAILEFSPSF